MITNENENIVDKGFVNDEKVIGMWEINVNLHSKI